MRSGPTLLKNVRSSRAAVLRDSVAEKLDKNRVIIKHREIRNNIAPQKYDPRQTRCLNGVRGWSYPVRDHRGRVSSESRGRSTFRNRDCIFFTALSKRDYIRSKECTFWRGSVAKSSLLSADGIVELREPIASLPWTLRLGPRDITLYVIATRRFRCYFSVPFIATPMRRDFPRNILVISVTIDRFCDARKGYWVRDRSRVFVTKACRD